MAKKRLPVVLAYEMHQSLDNYRFHENLLEFYKNLGYSVISNEMVGVESKIELFRKEFESDRLDHQKESLDIKFNDLMQEIYQCIDDISSTTLNLKTNPSIANVIKNANLKDKLRKLIFKAQEPAIAMKLFHYFDNAKRLELEVKYNDVKSDLDLGFLDIARDRDLIFALNILHDYLNGKEVIFHCGIFHYGVAKILRAWDLEVIQIYYNDPKLKIFDESLKDAEDVDVSIREGLVELRKSNDLVMVNSCDNQGLMKFKKSFSEKFETQKAKQKPVDKQIKRSFGVNCLQVGVYACVIGCAFKLFISSNKEESFEGYYKSKILFLGSVLQTNLLFNMFYNRSKDSYERAARFVGEEAKKDTGFVHKLKLANDLFGVGFAFKHRVSVVSKSYQA